MQSWLRGRRERESERGRDSEGEWVRACAFLYWKWFVNYSSCLSIHECHLFAREPYHAESFSISTISTRFTMKESLRPHSMHACNKLSSVQSIWIGEHVCVTDTAVECECFVRRMWCNISNSNHIKTWRRAEMFRAVIANINRQYSVFLALFYAWCQMLFVTVFPCLH